MARDAETAFSFAVSLANRKNLGYLLELCSGISAIAGLADILVDPLPRYCHYQISRIVSDAILRSNASNEASATFRHDELRKLINNAINVTHNTESVKKMSEASGTESVRLELMRFLAQLGQIQLAPFEDDPALLGGRTIGLLEVIPARHRKEIEQKIAGASQMLAVPLEELIGISATVAARLYLSLLTRYARLWEEFNSCLPVGDLRLEEALRQLDQRALERYWSFTADSLIREGGASERETKAFLNLFSRAPDELREAGQDLNSAFQVGHPAVRMLPLDRYPVVALPCGRYIIPNITIFRNAFPHVLDFSLMDAYRKCGCDNIYNQVRGLALELYICSLISTRLPRCVLIPETEYRSPYGGRRSPDLCILDPSDTSLIAIEAKARRLSPAAAVGTTNVDLDQNHGPSVEALRKLPEKLDDVYTAAEFQPWRIHLERIPRSRAVLVSVVSDTVFFHDEIEPLRARFDQAHPLASLTEPFCFLDLGVFERAVDIAYTQKVSLAQLFREHYEDTRGGDPNTPAARLFRGRLAAFRS